MPQTLAVHVRAWHSLSVPGQVEAVTQSTHAPLPLQTFPLPHAAPDDFRTDPTGNAGPRLLCGVIVRPPATR